MQVPSITVVQFPVLHSLVLEWVWYTMEIKEFPSRIHQNIHIPCFLFLRSVCDPDSGPVLFALVMRLPYTFPSSDPSGTERAYSHSQTILSRRHITSSILHGNLHWVNGLSLGPRRSMVWSQISYMYTSQCDLHCRVHLKHLPCTYCSHYYTLYSCVSMATPLHVNVQVYHCARSVCRSDLLESSPGSHFLLVSDCRL